MKKIITIATTIALIVTLGTITPVSAAAAAIEVWPDDSIQDAVHSARPGDTILVHTGVYNQKVVIGKSHIKLVAEKGATLSGTSGLGIGIKIMPGRTGVTVKGFRILNFSSGIDLSIGANRNKIEKNEISASAIGIVVKGEKNQVVKNTITDAINMGIILRPLSRGNIIEKNDISSSTVGIWTSGDNNQLLGNKIDDSVNSGIGISGADNQVLKNTIKNVTHRGINLRPESSNTTVEKNNISNTRIGITIEGAGNQVLKNKIKDITDKGINLKPKSSDTLVEKNNISNTNIGISANGVDIRLVENKIKGSSSDGIYLASSSSGTLIEKNDISHSNVGITIDGSDNDVLGNKISKSLTDGISVNSDYNDIIKNKVRDSTDNGIVLFDRTTTDNLIQDNDVSKSGLWGIAATDGARGNIFRENKVKGIKLKKNEVKRVDSFDLYDKSFVPDDESDPLDNVWVDNKYKTSNF